jgi:hypothetical protein
VAPRSKGLLRHLRSTHNPIGTAFRPNANFSDTQIPGTSGHINHKHTAPSPTSNELNELAVDPARDLFGDYNNLDEALNIEAAIDLPSSSGIEPPLDDPYKDTEDSTEEDSDIAAADAYECENGWEPEADELGGLESKAPSSPDWITEELPEEIALPPSYPPPPPRDSSFREPFIV